jgi:hypothetical protein
MLGPETQGWTVITVGGLAAVITLVIIFTLFRDNPKYQDQNKDQH